jgi:hypothetical protein
MPTSEVTSFTHVQYRSDGQEVVMTLGIMDWQSGDRVTRVSELDMNMDAILSFGSVGSDEGFHGETRHFKRLIEAILFAVEDLPRERRSGARIHVGDQTLGWVQIKAEYHRRSDAA